MRKKSCFNILLICLMVLTTMFGCGEKEKNISMAADNFNKVGLPIVNEPVTLKVAARKREAIKKPFGELEVYKMLENDTNVLIDWDTTPEASWVEKKNLIIASGDWPDIFYGNFVFQNGEVTKFASDGVIIPLEDLIEEYAPNIQKVFEEYPEYKKYITAPDGHIYSLPVIDANFPSAVSAQFINKNWLDELGLDIPKTTDEFYEVLKAFKTRLKDGETPFTFMFENNVKGINGMFGSFGLVDNTDKLTVVDGEVIYTSVTEEYKNAVMYFHKLFDEGLIDFESFSQNGGVYNSKIKNKQTGVFNTWSLSTIFGEDYENSGYVFMPPLKGPNGDQAYFWNSTTALSGKGSFMITSTCENPEVAMRWADYQVEPEISFQVCHGLLGARYEKRDDGRYYALPLPEGMGQNEFRHLTTAGANSFNMVPASFLKNVEVNYSIAEKNSYEDTYRKVAGNEPLPPNYISPEDASRAAELNSDIGAYQKEKLASWLMNGGIEKEWDDYKKKMYQMGLDEMVEIYQKRYDEVYK